MERTDTGRQKGRLEAIDQLRSLIDRTRPVATAEKKILPVLPAFEDLLVDQGLRRGTTIRVDGHIGATSLALAVSAGPTRSGSWLACIGVPEMGWAAAAEVGVDMNRVAVVRSDESALVTTVAALVDAFDLVLCGTTGPVSPSEARRLAARVRERDSVLVVLSGHTGGVRTARKPWPEVTDVALSVVDSEWMGAGSGNGRLGRRRMTVEVSGRRGLSRPRRVDLLLPGPDGKLSVIETPKESCVEESGVVVPFRRAG